MHQEPLAQSVLVRPQKASLALGDDQAVAILDLLRPYVAGEAL